MLKQLETWWQSTTPETQAYVWDGGLALLALLGGHIFGSMVARALRARNFSVLLPPQKGRPSELTSLHAIAKGCG